MNMIKVAKELERMAGWTSEDFEEEDFAGELASIILQGKSQTQSEILNQLKSSGMKDVNIKVLSLENFGNKKIIKIQFNINEKVFKFKVVLNATASRI